MTADQKGIKQVFIKKGSVYSNFFENQFKNTHLLSAWEKDITGDKKPDFIFLTNQGCPKCKNLFSIYQGERKVFEITIDNANIILQENGFVIGNGQTKFYQWTPNGFLEAKDVI